MAMVLNSKHVVTHHVVVILDNTIEVYILYIYIAIILPHIIFMQAFIYILSEYNIRMHSYMGPSETRGLL